MKEGKRERERWGGGIEEKRETFELMETEVRAEPGGEFAGDEVSGNDGELAKCDKKMKELCMYIDICTN